MSNENIQDSVRYVISGKHSGGALPGRRDEMWRDVYLESGAEVGGGIFGNNLFISGSVRVNGAVYVRGSIRISTDSKSLTDTSTVDFNSVVSTPDSILIDDDFPQKVRFFADIFTGQAKLHNSFVRGNIYAKNAIIRNSIILGGIFCSDSLNLENVIISTFRAKKVNLSPELLIFFPFAIAEEPIELNFHVKALSFSNLKDMIKGSCKHLGDVVFMNQDDIIELKENLGEEEIPLHMLSLGPRILDIENLKKQFIINKQLLESLSLGDHLDTISKKEFSKKELANFEEVLFELLEQPPKEESIRTTDLKVLERREEVKDFIQKIESSYSVLHVASLHNAVASRDEK